MEAVDLTLPSGMRLRVVGLGEGAPMEQDRFRGQRFCHGRLYRALDEGRLSVEGTDGGAAFCADDLDDLHLPDFHALRDAAQRVGAIAKDGGPWLCRNCDGELLGGDDDQPTVDLAHWYVEDLPRADGDPFPLTEGGPVVALAPTTAGIARPFFRAAIRRTFHLSGPVVQAMGITALGELTAPGEIAAAVEELPDEAWEELLAAYEDLAYSPKSYFPVLCRNCETLHDMPAPPDREVGSAGIVGGAGEAESPFLDEEQFASLVLELGAEVYRAMGVQNIELEVVTGVADVDATGEPLLGSYQPRVSQDPSTIAASSPDLGELSFLIRVYYRTFARMYEDGPYDVEAEVRETLEHEVQHHLHYLQGYDPMDDAERDEALTELERTYGQRAFRAAKVADAVASAQGLAWMLAGALFVLGIMVLFLRLTGRL
ncbi:MAG: metallopeptidase family protein [Deltaproteobacteria bacterium]|nr:metallopeptidase family protein [Deltaproteobacteria bacterium]